MYLPGNASFANVSDQSDASLHLAPQQRNTGSPTTIFILSKARNAWPLATVRVAVETNYSSEHLNCSVTSGGGGMPLQRDRTELQRCGTEHGPGYRKPSATKGPTDNDTFAITENNGVPRQNPGTVPSPPPLCTYCTGGSCKGLRERTNLFFEFLTALPPDGNRWNRQAAALRNRSCAPSSAVSRLCPARTRDYACGFFFCDLRKNPV
uniref:Uncharacterized protein n=1 Tax=Steinernema glaseri TaxID=37863 RepID=A0A1I7ZB14_9BILA